MDNQASISQFLHIKWPDLPLGLWGLLSLFQAGNLIPQSSLRPGIRGQLGAEQPTSEKRAKKQIKPCES